MRLIKNIYGEPAPLIMHPWLRLLRLAHLKVRRARCKITGQSYSLPSYWRSTKTPEQQERILRACENFMGAHGADPDSAQSYRRRAVEDLLASPTVSAERKEQLRSALDEQGAAAASAVTAFPASASNGSVPDVREPVDPQDVGRAASADTVETPNSPPGPALAH